MSRHDHPPLPGRIDERQPPHIGTDFGADVDFDIAVQGFAVARFARIVADQARSRRYMRRSNAVSPGFRRHQRRGSSS